MEHFHALKICCSLPSHPLLAFLLQPLSLHKTSGNHRLYLNSFQPFPECHIDGILQYVILSDWPFSLSNMHLMFLHVFSCLGSTFIFTAE